MSATTMQRPTSISFRSPQSSSADNMSMTQTYFLAHKARAKLSREAAQPDHDLRFLVGHANLLDTLMLELAEVERAQEQWFNQSVRGASTTTSTAQKLQDRHVQWSENLAQVPEEEYDSEEETSDEEEEDDLEEDYEQLSLVRTPSRSNSPPELIEESDSEDEDESMPASPKSAVAQLSTAEKDDEQSEEEESLYKESYYLPKGTAPAVSAIPVY
jgi:hypothetical protein